jgi:hypothetical protein
VSRGRRLDPQTGSTLILEPEGLTVLSGDGGHHFIPAPPGYSLSHFGEGSTVVARGDAQADGWWDWHFAPDLEEYAWRRLGPAY